MHSSTSQVSFLLATEQLTIGYRTDRHIHPVANNLQLGVPQGQLVCLLGPNGSGKSTLLRTLAGMQPPLSGHVQLGKQPLDTLTAQQRATHLAVVLTEPTYANLTVYDLVAMGRYPHTGWLGRLSERDRQAVEHAMRVTHTLDFADRPVGTLSDGERQKVMIARAVAQDTPVLILDEPTAHLDVPNRMAVLRLLHQLAQQYQKAVLLSTHALDLALLIADRLWLMHEGRVGTGVPEDLALDGTLAQVFAQDGVTFDTHTGTFQLPRPRGPLIGLNGPQPEVYWTRRALERVGYTVTEAGDHPPQVRVVSGPPSRWMIYTACNAREVASIQKVLVYLASVSKS